MDLQDTDYRAALRAHADTTEVDVTIDARKETIVLSGIVSNPCEYQKCTDIAEAVLGVKSLINELGTMTGGLGGRIFPGELTR